MSIRVCGVEDSDTFADSFLFFVAASAFLLVEWRVSLVFAPCFLLPGTRTHAL